MSTTGAIILDPKIRLSHHTGTAACW